MLLLCKGFKFFSCLELKLIKDSFWDVRVTCGVVLDNKIFLAKLGANFH